MYANTKKPTANGHEYKEEPQMNANAHRSKTKEAEGMSFRASGFRPMALLSILASPDEQELVPSRTFIEARSSVRELRQRRAYYRCCIPALAGFVSHRSIAPDGFSTIRLDESLEQRLF